MSYAAKASRDPCYLGGGADGGLVVQEEANHVGLPEMARRVKWGVTSLKLQL